MTGGRLLGSPVPASPLENDDILTEILLGLPPALSSLPRASVVCKRWRRLVADPVFLRRFRARHCRSAPLLGFFTHASRDPSFTPTLEPPDRIPPGRFSLELDDGCEILGCRHGLVLVLNRKRRQVLVWEPVTGDVSRVAFPPGFGGVGGPFVTHGAVLGAAGDVQGVDGHRIPFLVAVIGNDENATRAFACVFLSVTGVWGNLISTPCPRPMVAMGKLPSSLVGCSLYWMLGFQNTGILEFDLDRQCLAVIDLPPGFSAYSLGHWVMPTEGGSLGFLCLSGYTAQIWMRKTASDGVARWVLGRTIELDKLLSLDSEIGFPPLILGFSEQDNAFFLGTTDGVFIVQLESMQFKKPFKMSILDTYHCLTSVYAPGMGMDGGHDGPELLPNA